MLESDLKKLIEEFVQTGGFNFDNIDVRLDMDSGSYWASISTTDSHHLIGKNGETIQFINHLIKRMLEKRLTENTPRIIVDINDYQKNKIDKVKTIAHMMAERARFFKSKIELEPMNAYERRIVHDFVSKHPDLASESAGFGSNRRVTIFFKQN